ncbi:hypothetical protein FXO37_27454 [Capsicum annuum]|nr:hypothetical protein FXO37_27454 [Capsicum annuum]
MKVKIYNWNVMGLKESKKTNHQTLLKKWKVDIVCLQETKIEEWLQQSVGSLWRNEWASWADLQANGTSGRIIIQQGLYSILFKCYKNGKQWLMKSGLPSNWKLAANWPPTMQIVRLISQDHMNNKQYVGKADFLVFRAMNQHGFLSQLQEKKLVCVPTFKDRVSAAREYRSFIVVLLLVYCIGLAAMSIAHVQVDSIYCS